LVEAVDSGQIPTLDNRPFLNVRPVSRQNLVRTEIIQFFDSSVESVMLWKYHYFCFSPRGSALSAHFFDEPIIFSQGHPGMLNYYYREAA
jgi:hypothetical protein